MVKFKNIDLQRVFSIFIKNKIKNIEAQIGKILRPPSTGRNLLILIKKACNGFRVFPKDN